MPSWICGVFKNPLATLLIHFRVLCGMIFDTFGVIVRVFATIVQALALKSEFVEFAMEFVTLVGIICCAAQH